MVTIVTVTKKTKLHDLRTNSHRKWVQSPGKNILKAWRGPLIRSPNKSVIADLFIKICNEVLAKFLLQIVAKINPFFTTATAIKLPLPLPLKYEMHCQGNRAFYRCGLLKSIETQTYAMYMYGKKSYWTWCSLVNKRENLSQISC